MIFENPDPRDKSDFILTIDRSADLKNEDNAKNTSFVESKFPQAVKLMTSTVFEWQDTDYPVWGVPWFYSASSDRYLGNILKQITTAFFPIITIPPNAILIAHHWRRSHGWYGMLSNLWSALLFCRSLLSYFLVSLFLSFLPSLFLFSPLRHYDLTQEVWPHS